MSVADQASAVGASAVGASAVRADAARAGARAVTDATNVALVGPWVLRPDPENRGTADGWWDLLPWWDGHGLSRVPSAWQHALGHDYHGVAWYGKIERMPRPWWAGPSRGGRIWLRFDAAATDCRAWVNGIEVGRHVGDFLPFQFDATDALLADPSAMPAKPPFPGEAVIVVRVDEMHAPRPAPGVLVENGHITKGFHDVLSLQHGGLWAPVSLHRTGRVAFIPDGLAVYGDPATGLARVVAEFEPHQSRGALAVVLRDEDGRTVAAGGADVAPGQGRIELTLRVDGPRAWWPESPVLYHAEATATDDAGLTDLAAVRFGFRLASTGGPSNRHILLNGRPIHLRGVLYWGHEPGPIAPAPPPEKVRDEFAQLRARGFNTVCLCMWYAPDWFYDIADETGMLVWQEHPVWKSPMHEAHHAEYRRLFEGFFRRDRRHASVVMVSGSCEHERIHPDLARDWWAMARAELPGRVVQLQTAFIAWCNPDQTDTHDEHVYDSSGRWAAFLEDLQEELATLPPKPFTMGETIIGTSWIDSAALLARVGDSRPWWFPRGFDELARFEAGLDARFGPGVADRLRAEGDEFNIEQRRFQAELFRSYPNHAGFVMNHINDVPVARCGFRDDLGRWRWSPEQLLPWLTDAPILLRTPGHRRGFAGGRSIDLAVGVSNFGREAFDGAIHLEVMLAGRPMASFSPAVRAGPGEVTFAPVRLDLPAVDRPTPLSVVASAPGLVANGWTLWVFPLAPESPPGVVRLDGIGFDSADLEPSFEERSYSSGWGLKVRSWRPMLPDPTAVAFKTPLWRFDGPMPPGTRAVITHRLTDRLVDFLAGGWRAVLLASRTAGGLGAVFVPMYAHVPLVLENGPLGPGDAAWVRSLLHHDLLRRTSRAIPVGELGLADLVDPAVRLIVTHDQAGGPKLYDLLFSARVGRGLLVATALDHLDDPGQHLAQRLVRYAVDADPARHAALPPDRLTPLCWRPKG